MVTTAVDAHPQMIASVTGPAWCTLFAAIFTGGAFIFPTFKLYVPAAISAAIAVLCIVWWHWTATAQVPAKRMRDAGLGLRLPVYATGMAAPGWWGLFITMMADATAFASLVFGVFFYWTARPDFPPPDASHADPTFVTLAAIGLISAWAATLGAREANRRGMTTVTRLGLAVGPLLGLGGAGLLAGSLLGPDLDPAAHVYPAMMWSLTVWIAAHALAGAVMQLYCLAGSFFGKLTREYDADLWNVTLFWHFLALMAAIASAMIGLVPRLM